MGETVKKVKGTCANNLFVYNEITTRLINRKHITERYVVLPHKDLRNACSSLQGDAQQTLAYDMTHCSPEETMSSYDEHVCLTISRALMENHCFNMSEQ